MDKSDDRVGHLTTILARRGENLNNPFSKVQMPGVCPGRGYGSFDLIDALVDLNC